jgi:putative transposase
VVRGFRSSAKLIAEVDESPYLILEGRYEKVRYGGSVVSCAVLVAFGVDTAGKRSVLGVCVSLSETEVDWQEFLAGFTPVVCAA